MDIDVKGLTFEDAGKEEKSRLFRMLNKRSFAWLFCAAFSFLLPFILPGRFKLMTIIVLGVAALVLIYAAVSDLPARSCKICYGTVSNKREVSASEDTGLYYDAVTFTSDKGEVIDAFPVFSDKTYALLDEGCRAAVVCYNSRQPVLIPDSKIHPAK